ncbi:MAG: FecR domain-containing protein [Sediminicola sp.]
MKPKKIQKLIIKYITASISRTELDELEIVLITPLYKQLFNDYVKLNFRIDRKMKTYDTERSKELLLATIKRDKGNGKRFRIRKIVKYAALIIVSMTLGYFGGQELLKKVSEKDYIPQENFITLELEDGNIKVISEDGSSEVRDAKGNLIGSQSGKQLVYTNGSGPVTGKPIYNTLHVPYGKHFELKLSDGSVAFMNSGSTLRYPVRFVEGQDRTVFLTGEAFLEVEKDTTRPFIVMADDLNVKVFGTKFNVSAYPEDKVKEVVLVEGSVGLYPGKGMPGPGKGTVLTPGTKGSYDKAEGNITTAPVITSIYTSWVHGVLVFRNMTFENILKKLERHYDVTIINKNSKLSNARFNASFDDMPIEKVLEYFRGAYEVDFTIVNDQIIVN